MNDGRQTFDRIAHKGGGRRPDEELSFDPNVKQPGAETQGDCQPGENVGGGIHQAFEDGIDRAADFQRIPGLEGLDDAHRVAERAREERPI